jgi:hypothetical protein
LRWFFGVRQGKNHVFMTETASEESKQLGDSFRQSRKEMWGMLAAWAVFFAWSIGYCWAYGFADPNAAEVPLLFGVPRWVMIGIALPWLVANVFTIWFAGWFMQDTSLGDDASHEVISDK